MKNMLIARQQAFVAHQKVSVLSRVVIPAADVDDPLIADPIRLTGFDYGGTTLVFVLSGAPSSDWIWQFQNLGNYGFIVGKEPSVFQFSKDRAFINADERDAQQLVDYFKGYVEATNRAYRESVVQRHAMEQKSKREELEDQLREAERRRTILSNLKL